MKYKIKYTKYYQSGSGFMENYPLQTFHYKDKLVVVKEIFTLNQPDQYDKKASGLKKQDVLANLLNIFNYDKERIPSLKFLFLTSEKLSYLEFLTKSGLAIPGTEIFRNPIYYNINSQEDTIKNYNNLLSKFDMIPKDEKKYEKNYLDILIETIKDKINMESANKSDKKFVIKSPFSWGEKGTLLSLWQDFNKHNLNMLNKDNLYIYYPGFELGYIKQPFSEELDYKREYRCYVVDGYIYKIIKYSKINFIPYPIAEVKEPYSEYCINEIYSNLHFIKFFNKKEFGSDEKELSTKKELDEKEYEDYIEKLNKVYKIYYFFNNQNLDLDNDNFNDVKEIIIELKKIILQTDIKNYNNIFNELLKQFKLKPFEISHEAKNEYITLNENYEIINVEYTNNLDNSNYEKLDINILLNEENENENNLDNTYIKLNNNNELNDNYIDEFKKNSSNILANISNLLKLFGYDYKGNEFHKFNFLFPDFIYYIYINHNIIKIWMNALKKENAFNHIYTLYNDIDNQEQQNRILRLFKDIYDDNYFYILNKDQINPFCNYVYNSIRDEFKLEDNFMRIDIFNEDRYANIKSILSPTSPPSTGLQLVPLVPRLYVNEIESFNCDKFKDYYKNENLDIELLNLMIPDREKEANLITTEK